jgi:hypothetical protein
MFPFVPVVMPPPGGGADDSGAPSGDQCFGAQAKRSFPPGFSNNLPFVMGHAVDLAI